MTTITTLSGMTLDLLKADVRGIHIDDIAHALSMICRFGGHVPYHYSVGQHSWLVYELARDTYPSDWITQIYALMHDAAEAYLGDIVKPLKPTLKVVPEHSQSVTFDDVEEALLRTILHAVGVTTLPFKPCMERVRSLDEHALAIESRDLKGISSDDIGWRHLPIPSSRYMIFPQQPLAVRELFLKTFNHLKEKVAR